MLPHTHIGIKTDGGREEKGRTSIVEDHGVASDEGGVGYLRYENAFVGQRDSL